VPIGDSTRLLDGGAPFRGREVAAAEPDQRQQLVALFDAQRLDRIAQLLKRRIVGRVCRIACSPSSPGLSRHRHRPPPRRRIPAPLRR